MVFEKLVPEVGGYRLAVAFAEVGAREEKKAHSTAVQKALK
jgi:hypothetical protein